MTSQINFYNEVVQNLQGSIPALITPMHADGRIDYDMYCQLIDWHITQGSNALITVGTTGESPTVNVDEHKKLIETAVKHTNKRIPVIAGTGGNSTQETIELTSFAKTIGADFALQVVPYYNKPTQEGIYQHYKAVANAVDIPTILYNVPGRTVADLQQTTALKLAEEIDSIVAIKDATGNLERGCHLLQASANLQKKTGKVFSIYSGDDATAALLMLMGAKGNMSVTANIAPKHVANLCAAAIAGNLVLTKEIQFALLELNQLLFVEANPIPVKYAVSLLKNNEQGIRLPLTTLSPVYQERIAQAMQTLNLI